MIKMPRKLLLVVKEGCPNCEYLLENMPENLKNRYKIVNIDELPKHLKTKVKAAPAVLIPTFFTVKVDYVPGTLLGIVKLTMIAEKYK